MTMTANPRRTTVQEIGDLLSLGTTKDEVTETYGVFNNEEAIQAMVQSGRLHTAIADKLREPLFTSEMDSAAKRFLLWTNENRVEGLDKDIVLGMAELRQQTVTRTPWHVLTPEELAAVDEGRRANG